jgi:uncharacterized repeat protein (TIGR01451 family)
MRNQKFNYIYITGFLLFISLGNIIGQSVQLTASNIDCNGLNNGTINITLLGSPQGPFYYQISTSPPATPMNSGSTPNTSYTFSNLSAGNYNVYVAFGTGATWSGNVTITEPPVLASSIVNVTHLLCNNDMSGSLTVIPNGGTPPYTIALNGPTNANLSTTNPGMPYLFTNLSAGFYSVLLTDSNGCIVISSVLITEPAPLVANVTGTAASSPSALDGTATVNFTGGTPPYTINWWNIGANTQTISSLGVGVYSACVTDGNGCVSCDSFIVISSGIDSICVTGQVFCDQDNNGIFSNGDIPLNNAAVSINHLGGLLTVYTDNLGNYNASFFGLPGNTSFVSVNSNWLSSQGYTTNTNSYSFTNVSCLGFGQPSVVPLPVNCGPNTGFTECYSGYVFCDANLDGQMNTGELPLVNFPVTLSNNSFTATVFTNSIGYFSYCGQIASLVFDPTYATVNQMWLIANGYTNINPTTLISGSGSVGSTTPCMIPINCSPSACIDLWSNCSWSLGGGNYYQGNPANIALFWGNNGPNPSESYSLSLTYPAGVTVNTATIDNNNYTISGNTITWNFPASPNLTTSFDNIMFYVPSGIPSGTPHYFISNIIATGASSDCNIQNDSSLLLQIVGNSYDPNDKVVSRNIMYQNLQNNTEEIDANIQDILTYTVRFQNTGTAPAQNVYILDTLDSNLDWSTFMPMQSSHPMTIVDLGNGVKRFEFSQIWLPDSTSNEPASHGALTYRIQENANNIVGSTIENTAYIYFDWNSPIVTNTTFNVNSDNWAVYEKLNQPISIFPNPTNKELIIQNPFDNEKSNYIIFDCFGKIIAIGDLESNLTKIFVDQFENGLYFLQIDQNRTSFVVMH